MNVNMWMTRDVLTVVPETSAAEAAKLMAQKQVRRLMVVEKWADGPHLLGIISAKDVIHAFPPHVNPFAIEGPDARLTPTTVSQIMTANPRTTTPDTPIEEVGALMCAHKIGALPVLRGKILAGIITESDVFRAFVSLLGTEQVQQPVRVVRIAGEGVDEVLDDLWSSGHIVINVIRFPFVPEQKV